MATPKKPAAKAPKASNPVPAPPKLADNVADAEAQALNDVRSFEFRRARTGENTSTLPMGRRIAAPPFIQARYNQKLADATLLGSAETIVSAAFRSKHPGWKYLWPIVSSNRTQAMLRSGVYKKVPFDDLDHTNPLAAVAPSPEGDTLWMQHILVAISPYWWTELYESAELESISRASSNRATVEDELNGLFGAGGYKAEVEEFTDQRTERIL